MGKWNARLSGKVILKSKGNCRPGRKLRASLISLWPNKALPEQVPTCQRQVGCCFLVVLDGNF
ncbi:MAG: hypothetical protein COV69_02235 [Parcubacteria group bacterium CG11_big_fil_rev_8_21_14_0_20_39_14]|nr:MAG: hypothetical protein COV69_02235 [Parcubacteria group bacterium CG11_big_fil_rev_8_21_14_0_20_39_14]PIS35309.1 MAG: hypothetical protein COT36_03075 [Parcubacteria group bacterium CG08_land_8_20_14_0_20_38_56]